MLDSGTTGHFIAVSPNNKNIWPTKNPLNIIIPDGNTMKSTHKCDIDFAIITKISYSGAYNIATTTTVITICGKIVQCGMHSILF